MTRDEFAMAVSVLEVSTPADAVAALAAQFPGETFTTRQDTRGFEVVWDPPGPFVFSERLVLR